MWLMLACAAPEPAPTELEDLIGWMYTHLHDETDEPAIEASVNLGTWTDAHLDETLEGYEVQVLDAESIASLGVEPRDLSGLEGVAVGYEHESDAASLAAAVMIDPRETHPDMYVEYSSEVLEGSKECFADGSCDVVEYTSHAVEDLGLGILLTIDSQLQFRRYETPEGTGFAYRYWTTAPPMVTTDLFKLDQSYFLWAFFPVDGKIRSMQASWVVVEVLDSDLDSDIVLNLWVNGMVKGAEEVDEL